MITANQLRAWRECIYANVSGIPAETSEVANCLTTIEGVLDEMHEAEIDMTREEVRTEIR